MGKQNLNLKYEIKQIGRDSASEFLYQHHYLSQMGHDFLAKDIHGLFKKNNNELVGVITYGGLAVAKNMVGYLGLKKTDFKDGFYELTRLSMLDTKEKNLTSWFVSHSIRKLRNEHKVRAILSYADNDFHHGYIYQATNWKYYGLTFQKKDFYAKQPNGIFKLKRRGKIRGIEGEWRNRSQKHRYLQVFDKYLKIQWKEQPYPKGNNKPMDLLEYEINEQTQLVFEKG